MTAFRYKALTAEGKKISGTVDAQGPREATQALRADGLHVTSIEAASGGLSAGFRRMSGGRSDEAWLFTSHMRRLVRAKLGRFFQTLFAQ